jgi:hypothetical protein
VIDTDALQRDATDSARFFGREMGRFKTLADAGNVLRMDRTYPGAEAQKRNLAARGGIGWFCWRCRGAARPRGGRCGTLNRQKRLRAVRRSSLTGHCARKLKKGFENYDLYDVFRDRR